VDGTSAAAPTIAGLVALINAHRAKRGRPALGFANPLLYQVFEWMRESAGASGHWHPIYRPIVWLLAGLGTAAVHCGRMPRLFAVLFLVAHAYFKRAYFPSLTNLSSQTRPLSYLSNTHRRSPTRAARRSTT
jgi:hypothetical protein